MISDLSSTDTPNLTMRGGGPARTPWAKRVVCYDCGWSKHVESKADDGGARACRLVMRQHSRQTKHTHFAICDGRPKNRKQGSKHAGEKSPAPDTNVPQNPTA